MNTNNELVSSALLVVWPLLPGDLLPHTALLGERLGKVCGKLYTSLGSIIHQLYSLYKRLSLPVVLALLPPASLQTA